MTTRRRTRSVFDQLVSELRIEISVASGQMDLAVTAAHEAAHAVVGDMFGVVGSVHLDGGNGGGQALHYLAPALSEPFGAHTAARENALVALAGPASEMIVLGRWAIVATGSSDDFLGAWRSLASSFPVEAQRVARIGELLDEAQRLLIPLWPRVTSVAGHLLEQGELQEGQVQRILSGVEPDRSQAFFSALRGSP